MCIRDSIGNASMGFEIGSTFGGSEIFDTTFLVYALNIIISFILISLFNVQEQIENPFDGDGMDDIKLENYELDYLNNLYYCFQFLLFLDIVFALPEGRSIDLISSLSKKIFFSI